MAEIAPFCGLRYNPERIPDLTRVVIPPYDVISSREQRSFHEKSPFNMVRLELGETMPDDSEEGNPHTRAGAYLRQWVREGIFARENEPAIYYYELEYDLAPGVRETRYGFICTLRLEDFSSGSVRPHEKTFQNVKDERLRLMLSCEANLSPVFALYSDPSQSVDTLLRSSREDQAAMSFEDVDGMVHRVWRVTDPAVLGEARALMMDKGIIIADGHHRYETGLNYRNIQRQRSSRPNPRAAFEYIMMYLSNMNQTGLTILPTHRMLRNLDAWDQESLLNHAKDFFEISDFDAGKSGKNQWIEGLLGGGFGKETVVGFHCPRKGAFHLLRAKRKEVASYLKDLAIHETLHELDVVVLDQIVLRKLMGLSENFLADESNIHFKHDLGQGLAELKSGIYDVGFFINPTRIEQVQEVAGAGLIMPHKSTYFYPKVGSGLVIRLLGPGEEILC